MVNLLFIVIKYFRVTILPYEDMCLEPINTIVKMFRSNNLEITEKSIEVIISNLKNNGRVIKKDNLDILVLKQLFEWRENLTYEKYEEFRYHCINHPTINDLYETYFTRKEYENIHKFISFMPIIF